MASRCDQTVDKSSREPGTGNILVYIATKHKYIASDDGINRLRVEVSCAQGLVLVVFTLPSKALGLI